MQTIKESSNYSKFEMAEFNRNVKDTKKLELSFLKYGWIDAFPMLVVSNGEKYTILAGHNRFIAAKKIGIPLKYVICHGDFDMAEIEIPGKGWTKNDFLDSYCRKGCVEYLRLKQFCEESGITVSLAASLLTNNTGVQPHFEDAFKRGGYKITATGHAYAVKDVVLYLKKCGVSFYSITNLVHAISRVLRVPDFDVARLMVKIKKHTSLIERKANLDQYMDMLEMLYNYHQKNAIPLKFLANQEVAKRNAIKK